ncbi:Ig-like domain-containing protein [Halomonas pacifica]|uniref:Ig-like domain-containing protein n=1 Tax=Bisbaumannia pacifica TaxID=77098 RepID=UPI0023591790|nr:Ig-like domain-containing protein [Halomonas pacifica]MDC8803651.1 Ig-like domain-containing protein [Halomonas pacifica]
MQIGDTRYNVEVDGAVDGYLYGVDRVGDLLYVTYGSAAGVKVVAVSPDGTTTEVPSPSISPKTNDDSDTIVYTGLSDGNILVTWYSSSSGKGFTDTYFKVIDDSGQEIVGATKINSEAGSLNRFTEVAELSDGNLAFVWATSGSNYAMRRFEPDGTPVDADQLSVTSLAGVSGSQYSHQIAASDGGFIITWDAYDYNSYLGMLFDNASSTPTQVGGQNRFEIGDSIAKGNATQYVETLPNGNYLVLFKGATGDSSTRDVRFQIYDDNGTAVLSSDAVIGGMNSWGGFSEPIVLEDRLVVSYSYVDYNTDPTTIERYLVSYDFDGNLIEDLSSSLPSTQAEYGDAQAFLDVDGNLSWAINDDDTAGDDYDIWLLRQADVIPEGGTPNQAPSLTGTTDTLQLDDDATGAPFATLSFEDADGDGGSIIITYEAANGELSGEGLSGEAGQYTLSGANPTELTSRLRALEFIPTENQVAPGEVQETSFSLTPNDGSTSGTALVGIKAQVTSINDAPTASLAGGDVVQAQAGSTDHTLTVTYEDADSTVDAASLGVDDIQVTKGGQSLVITDMTIDSGGGTATTQVTYTLAAPGGSWDDGDNGTYAVTLVDSAVVDELGLGVAEASLGSFQVSLDTTAPAIPGVPSLAAGEDSGRSDSDGVISSPTPTLEGSGVEPGATLTLSSDRDGVIGTALADGTGSWSLTLPSALADGAHQITVTATDTASNVSGASAALALTVDSQAPARPDAPSLANGVDSGVSESDNLTQQLRPVLQGNAEPDALITVTSDRDGELGTVLADATGAWTFTPSADLSEGEHSLNVVASDLAGNASQASVALVATIDATAPSLDPVASSPANGALPVAVDSDLELAFSEAVHFIGGSIRLVADASGTTVASWTPADVGGSVSGEGSDRLTLTPPSSLEAETRYRIEIDAGALVDGAGNALAGVGDGTLEFTSEVPGALYTNAAGFDTSDGTGILGGASVDVGDNTIIVTDHEHLVGATLDGGGGSNRVILSDSSQADFSAAALVANIASVEVAGSGSFQVAFGAASGWTGLSSFQGNGETSLDLSLGHAIDLTGQTLSGIKRLDVDTGGQPLTLSGDQLSVLNAASGSLNAAGGIELHVVGAEADTSQMALVLNGFDQISMRDAGNTTLLIEPVQLLFGGTYHTLDTAGSDVLRSQDAQLDFSFATLAGWDTLENTQSGAATTRLTAAQLSGDLETIAHADADGADILEVSGAVVDLTGLTFTHLDTLSLLDSNATLRLDSVEAAQFSTLQAAGAGTEILQSAAASLDLSEVSQISGFEALETTHAGDATLSVADADQFAIYRAQAGFENTLRSGATEFDLTGLTLQHISRFATTNADGTVFTGTVNAETLIGGDGDDVFAGGGGADTLTGGAGADRFMAADGLTISDFSSEDTLRVAGAAGITADQLAFTGGVLTIDTNADGDVTSVDPSDLIEVNLGSLRGRFQVTDAGADADITFTPSSGGGSTPTPEPPQEDGASVSRENQGGQSIVTVEPISPEREDDPDTPNGNLADIVLAEDAGGVPALQIGLPVGVGLRSEGTSGRQSRDDALADLIGRIEAKTEDDVGQREEMTGIGRSFLDALPTDASILVRTVTPSIAEGTSSVGPLVISGATASDRQEALVIDVSQLPRGTVLRLEDVEFAAIVGEARVIGGSGANTVVGDDSAQVIVLGEDDDILYGGGGDDTVGSKGGDDRLFGGNGNDELFGGAGADLLHGGRDDDLASYEGNRDDYLVTQEHGVITVTLKEDPSDVDTLVNIETLSFADGEERLTYDDDLAWITGLYAQVLGRQADVGGVQYWAQRHAEGMSEADMAISFMASTESGQRLSVQEEGIDAVLDTLYQSLLGREGDAEGHAYWADRLASGVAVEEVVASFVGSEEMRTHDLSAQQWDFIA